MIKKDEHCNPQCYSNQMPDASSSLCSGNLKMVCKQCRPFMMLLEKYLDEPDVEVEFNPNVEEYDPYAYLDEMDGCNDDCDDGHYDY